MTVHVDIEMWRRYEESKEDTNLNGTDMLRESLTRDFHDQKAQRLRNGHNRALRDNSSPQSNHSEISNRIKSWSDHTGNTLNNLDGKCISYPNCI